MESRFPFPLVLVGVDESRVPELRMQLSLAAAEIESEFSTADAALECMRKTRERSRLLLIELGDACDVKAVEHLGGYFLGWPILALASPETSLEEIQRVYRAGARQVVLLPIDSEDFHQALHTISLQLDRGANGRNLIAVAGITGGAGATTLAINLAYEISQGLGRSTILAELTLQVSALATMLDVHPVITWPYLLREIDRVDELLLEKALLPYDGMKILAGATQAAPVPNAKLTRVARVIDGLKGLADVTVLDVPGTFNEQDLGVMYSADQTILVGLQNVPSVRTLKLFCEMFPEERVNHSLWIAINRYNPQLKGYTCAEIKEMLGTPNVVPISNDYQAAIRAINHGQPLRKAAPGTAILRDLDGLIHSLLGIERDKPLRRDGFMRRFANALNL